MSSDGDTSTASLQSDLIRPVRDKELIVKGRIVRKVRRIVFAEAEITNHEGVILARGTQAAVRI